MSMIILSTTHGLGIVMGSRDKAVKKHRPEPISAFLECTFEGKVKQRESRKATNESEFLNLGTTDT